MTLQDFTSAPDQARGQAGIARTPPATTDSTDSEHEHEEWQQWQELTQDEKLFTVHRSLAAFSNYVMDKLDLIESRVEKVNQDQAVLASKCATATTQHDEVTRDVASIKTELETIACWLPQQRVPGEMRKVMSPEVQKLLFTDHKCPVTAVGHNNTLIAYLAESPLATNEPRLKPFVDALDNEETAGEMCSVARDALGQGRKQLKSKLTACDTEPKTAKKLAVAPLLQWAKAVSPYRIRSSKWNDGKGLQARYGKLRMFRDLPAHCGIDATSVPSVRGQKRRRETVSSDVEAVEGEQLSAEDLLAKKKDPRFVCADLEAAEGLLRVALKVKASSESYWDAYVKFEEWYKARGFTDESIVQADASVYSSEPATPRAGGVTGSGAGTGAGAGEAGETSGTASGSVGVSAGAGAVTTPAEQGAMAMAGLVAAPDTPTPSGARPSLVLWRSGSRRKSSGLGGPSSGL